MLPTARKLSFSEVPVVDLGPAWSDGDAGRRQVAEAIASAAGTVGFFYIRNHGLSAADIDAVFQTAKDFHNLPRDAKMEVSMTLNDHAQGYLHGMTKGNDAKLKENLQEAFQIRRPLPDDDPDLLAGKPLHGVIPWPSAMPDLKPRMLAYYDRINALGYALLDLFELSLELAAADNAAA
jgi:isopenicillin N synthase-like dioxygenase